MTLPPEDRRPDAFAPVESPGPSAFGPASQENPIAVAQSIYAGSLQTPRDVGLLRSLVTPESARSWGDFSGVAERLDGCGMTSQPNFAEGDEDVCYVKFITDHDGQTYQVTEDVMVMLRAVATMVYRRDLGGWRMHALGDYVAPEAVPHGNLTISEPRGQTAGEIDR